MRRRARWLLLPLLLAGPACDDSEAEKSKPAAEAPAEAPAETPETKAPEDEDETVEIAGDLPTEPVVRLIEPSGKTPVHLPARAPGGDRRVVVDVKITEGKKKKLHLPITRIAADVALESIGDDGSSYRWTPVDTTVISDEGVDPGFLATFTSALATEPTPVARPLKTDRFDAVTDLAWPSGSDPHAATVGMAQRLALGHLALPVPQLELGRGAKWQVNRRVDLFGIPAWQTLDCTAKKIVGGEMEVEAAVTYRLIEGEPIAGTPLGQSGVVGLTGQGKLRARYHLASATPIDMQLLGKLSVITGAGKKRFGFELRVDEDFMARPDPRVTLTGKFVQGGLVMGKVPPGTGVWFNKRKLKVGDEGDFVIGFGRDAAPRALLAFSFDGKPNERHTLHVEDRSFEPEAIDGLPPEMVDLDKETRKALNKSRGRITKVRNKGSDTPYYREGFRWPAKGKITSTYGRKRILNGEDRGFHWGVDLGARVGGKVKAPAGGVIVFAEKDVPLSGNLIILDHGHGVTSSFLHLEKIKVKVGDEVKKGQLIGTIGNTGRSTGPHLDWRMNLFDTRIDPQTLVPPKP